ncbi:LSM domain-containing protein [Rhypophila decipiens]|uniref:LSM domain-containing protein n=1 Tax=Rhypophila decipiens TaxID=261697 RepID=A0AAN6YH40_9PEZI|nr:LSM domain-containing protein [Rhypophila decipiens]
MEKENTSQDQTIKMDGEEAKSFLLSLLCKNLRVTTTDSRMFWGSFKCTDPESNIVLQHTYEYRHPSQSTVAAAAAASSSTPPSSTPSSEIGNTVRVDMNSRYLGLVTIPGKYITKIEVEEFASQVQRKQAAASQAVSQSQLRHLFPGAPSSIEG